MNVRQPYRLTRPQRVFFICGAIFLTALVVAEATAGKFFVAFDLPFTVTLAGEDVTQAILTAGVIAFPITFIATDVINEYFGPRGIRFVTLVGLVMVIFEFLIFQVAIAVPTADNSPISAEAFQSVFGTSQRIIFGSLLAYLIGQLVDIVLFHGLRKLTKGRHVWLRATGSTFGSQFLDTFIVLTVAFWGSLSFPDILSITLFNYSYKAIIAIVITPLIYLAHFAIDRYLGKEEAVRLTELAESE